MLEKQFFEKTKLATSGAQKGLGQEEKCSAKPKDNTQYVLNHLIRGLVW